LHQSKSSGHVLIVDFNITFKKPTEAGAEARDFSLMPMKMSGIQKLIMIKADGDGLA